MSIVKFQNYNGGHFSECLKLFDENCPEYFAENEKADYIAYLERGPMDYKVGFEGSHLVSAFGLTQGSDNSRARVSWILVSVNSKGKGIGAQMMAAVKNSALEKKCVAIDIAASHLSAPFFKKYGAIVLNEIPNGWGKDMHRIDMEIILE